MKLLLIITAIVLFCGCAGAEDWSAYSNDQIVEAIYKAEGGSKATWLYGIKSVPYDSPEEARRICFNSVRNGRARWIKAGKPDDLIVFIGKRYCPPTVHSLNKNWVRNVKAILKGE